MTEEPQLPGELKLLISMSDALQALLKYQYDYTKLILGRLDKIEKKMEDLCPKTVRKATQKAKQSSKAKKQA